MATQANIFKNPNKTKRSQKLSAILSRMSIYSPNIVTTPRDKSRDTFQSLRVAVFSDLTGDLTAVSR